MNLILIWLHFLWYIWLLTPSNWYDKTLNPVNSVFMQKKYTEAIWRSHLTCKYLCLFPCLNPPLSRDEWLTQEHTDHKTNAKPQTGYYIIIIILLITIEGKKDIKILFASKYFLSVLLYIEWLWTSFRNSSVLEMMLHYLSLGHIPRKDLTILS